MSHFHSNMLLGASGNQGYEIARSLRFNDDDSAYLNFTPGSAGNQKTWTWSAWIKRSGNLGSNQNLFNPIQGGDAFNEAVTRFDANDRFQVYDSGTLRGNLITNKVFRDVTAWYHIVVALDTTQGTAANRLKVYVNGEQQTDLQTVSYPTQDTTWGWNGAQRHDLGRYAYGSSLYFDGYMAEIHFVDGTAENQYAFGETDSVTGEWIPKKYAGSHGSQGWYLDFSDNSDITATTLGKDSSGNGNNWTPNAFSVSAGTGNDSLEDTPTNNWCTLNALAKGTDATLSNGNLDVAYGSSATRTATIATMGMSSGKWYWEHKVTSHDSEIFGITNVSDDSQVSNYPGFSSTGWGIDSYDGQKYHNSTAASYGSAFATNDVIGCAFDADNGKLWWSKNGTFFASGDPAAGTNAAYSSLPSTTYYPAVGDGGGTGQPTFSINFGQRAFDYTPPTGFKALNTKNLPVPTIKNGTEYMQSVLYTGNATARSITGVGFQPDWTWIKGRTTTSSHTLYDVVRGATKFLSTHNVNAESTDADTLTSFNSDGFSIGADVKVNTNNHTYVAWNWKAGGTATTPTQGTIASTASVNADAGFSIVKYTGNSTAGATVGHGLGVAPKMIITKSSSTNLGNWGVYHYGVDPTSPEDYMLNLNLGNGRTNSNLWWNDTAPTSTVFTVGTSNDVNGSSDYIAYCFAEVEGYSKFGSYEGNGSTDGTFIYTGFSPSFFLLKDIDRNNTRWILMDSVRDPHNYAYHVLAPSSGVGEDTSESYWLLDFVSNGVKLRYGADNEFNRSGDTYIYMAFAESPFKYANAR